MRSSVDALGLVASRPAESRSFTLGLWFRFFASFIPFFCCSIIAAAQSATQQPPASSSTTAPESTQSSSEIASHDEPTTFKVNVKLVVVRVVVRDSQGRAVGNLQRDDFQIFDKGKPQVISQFELEQPGSSITKILHKADDNSGEGTSDESPSAVSATAMPERFVAYLFDDIHLEFGDLAHAREAAEHHFSALRPTDRAAIFTTSGQTMLDFTDDRTKLHETLNHLQPRPINSNIFSHQCPEISYYQADLIVNKYDPDARQVAILDAQQCGPVAAGQLGASIPLGNAGALVDTLAMGALTAGQHESQVSLGILKDTVHRVSRMPGQRTVVVVSPGFINPDLQYLYSDIVDQAVHSQVVISALDARGLYVVIPYGDASHQPAAFPGGPISASPPPVTKTQIDMAAARAQDDLLAVLAEGTGGVLFHNNNDFDEGFRRVAETPQYSYMLAFTPQNLKLDGSFHNLKVTLRNPQKLTLQARRGYYAPKEFANPEEQAKQEIEDAMYSQEELHNLPIKLHTQFFKASDEDAKLVVLAQVDVRHLRFRKVDGRNNNVLTCVSALFNRNGNFIQGMQKIVTMNLKDETLEHKLAAGITLKTSFDVKPGSYLVRLVVRDAEGQSISAENGTVEIR